MDESDPVWTVEQVAAVAPSPRAVAAAEPLATAGRWVSVGADARAVWGRCRGSGAEPYDTMVDHVRVAWRCSCPSRKLPCKHALALLLLWVRGGVPPGSMPAAVQQWVGRSDQRGGGSDGAGPDPGGAASGPDGSGGAARRAAGIGPGAVGLSTALVRATDPLLHRGGHRAGRDTTADP